MGETVLPHKVGTSFCFVTKFLNDNLIFLEDSDVSSCGRFCSENDSRKRSGEGKIENVGS